MMPGAKCWRFRVNSRVNAIRIQLWEFQFSERERCIKVSYIDISARIDFGKGVEEAPRGPKCYSKNANNPNGKSQKHQICNIVYDDKFYFKVNLLLLTVLAQEIKYFAFYFINKKSKGSKG